MKVMLIDGNSIINRAFYAIKLLSNKKGNYTNAIYGFITTLTKLREEIEPTNIAVAFDLKAPTFRHKMYDDYKGTRKGMPEELAEQMPVIKEILDLMGIKRVECEGFEADDILGTLAHECDKEGVPCVIATGDRDSLQLVTKDTNVRLVTTRTGKSEATIYTPEKVEEDYGVTPVRLIDVKALAGDTSDNIPGVPGVGIKTATDLVARFGTVDNIYEKLEELDIKPGVKTKLLNGKDKAYLSYKLGEISKEAKVSTNLDDYKITNGDESALKEKLIDLELTKIIDKLSLSSVSISASSEQESAEEVVFTKGEKISGKAFADRVTSDFIPVDFDIVNNEVEGLIACDKTELFAFTEKEDMLNVLCCGKAVVCHDGKQLVKALMKAGKDQIPHIFDTSVVGYLLNPNGKDYSPTQMFNECVSGNKIVKVDGVKEVSAQLSLIPIEDDQELPASMYNNCALIAELYPAMTKMLQENKMTELYENIERPLIEVLASMEVEGFKVDVQGIKDFGEKLKTSISNLTAEIYEQAGTEFNINSPKQLGETLFVTMGLPKGKKTKTGYSTSAEVLESLVDIHPIIKNVLEFRQLSKLNSTYVEGLLKVTDKQDRIHSTLNQTETKTGRLSSTEPNLQNIPIRTELGSEMRKFFVAKDGYKLVDADYSQIELRVLAHMADDVNMIKAFKDEADIHTITASQVFDMPENMVTPAMRSSAKAVNFGIVYGISAFSLSKDIGVSVAEADKYIKNYLSTYSGVKKYMEDSIKYAEENGYAKTIFNRRRYLPEINAKNKILKGFGDRVAMNMPIQGSAADIIKIAMVKVFNRLKNEKLDARLIMQVHDELIVEAKDDIAEKVEKLLVEEMEGAIKLSVPLTVDGNVGDTWFDAH